MNYRCKTCGFAQDFEPTPETVALHHPWMSGKNILQCPACTSYLTRWGGRKGGKIQMPDITEVGTIEPEDDESQLMTEDFNRLQTCDAAEATTISSKYNEKKLFGFTASEIRQLAKK